MSECKRKIDLMRLHHNEKILLCRIPCEEDELKSYRQEENICNHIPDKRLIHGIYEVSKVNIKKIKQSN